MDGATNIIKFEWGYIPVIESKLMIPYIKGLTMSRPNLDKKLDDGLFYTLTLITSPAGYGKSITLSNWSSKIDLPVNWISLDEGDNNPLIFWSNLLKSIEQSDARDVVEKPVDFKLSEADVTMFLSRLLQQPSDMVIVLDNFHVIRNSFILEGINHLLQGLPAHVHLYVSSQNKPSLSLSRLRMEGHVMEIGVDDFRLDEAESTTFLRECTNLKLTDKECKAIYDKSQGWIAGIKLIALSLQEAGHTVLDTIQTMVGKDTSISNYFREEIFNKISEEYQDFLLETSILNQMNVALCEELTGSLNSLHILQELEQDNILFVPLDAKEHCYRYHPMFQEFLKTELKLRKPEKYQKLHLNAGQWFVRNGYSEEAIPYYLMAEAYEEVFQLLYKVIPSLPGYRKINLHEWLNAIPNDLLFEKPMLFITNIASLFLSGNKTVAVKKYWWAMNEIEKLSNHFIDNEIAAFKAGLELLMAYRTFTEGDLEACVECSRKYAGNKLESDFLINLGTDRNGYNPIWDIYLSEGDLNQAAEMLPVLLEIWAQTKNKPFYVHLCIDYAKYLYEKNRLDDALYYARKALMSGKELGNANLYVRASFITVKIQLALGQFDIVGLRVQALKEYLDLLEDKVLIANVEQINVLIALYRGQKEIVSDWLEKCQLSAENEISVSMMETYYLYANAFMLEDRNDEALKILHKLLFLAEEHGKHQSIIRYMICKSYIYMKKNDKIMSHQLLEHALLLASKGAYVRVFLDFGQACEQLLVDYLKRVREGSSFSASQDFEKYAEQILGLMAYEKGENGEESTANNILTEKQFIVLQCIREGLSNKEIVEKLGISMSTVKTHIHQIYRKLNVNNRVMALKKAEKMRLL